VQYLSYDFTAHYSPESQAPTATAAVCDEAYAFSGSL
jgi:hypothetical protein